MQVLLLGPENHEELLGHERLRELKQYGVRILTVSGSDNPEDYVDRPVDGALLDERYTETPPDRLMSDDAPPLARLSNLTTGIQYRQFLEEMFGYRRLRTFTQKDGRTTMKHLYNFQGKVKYELMAHDPPGQKRLGQLLSEAKSAETIREEYRRVFRRILSEPITRSKHYNVLEHLVGHLPDGVHLRDRILGRLEDFKNHRVSWIIPFNLLRQFFRKSPFNWLTRQSYLFPGETEYKLKRSAWIESHPEGVYRTS